MMIESESDTDGLNEDDFKEGYGSHLFQEKKNLSVSVSYQGDSIVNNSFNSPSNSD